MDRIINVSVGGSYLKKDKKSAGVRGEANVTSLRITFDNSWDSYAKKITFLDARGQNPVNVTLGVNLIENIYKDERVYIVPIPAEPMAISGELTFIIEGTLDNKIQKSFADRLEVKDAPDTAGAVNAVDPTPSELAQFQTEIEFIKEIFGKSSYVGEDGTVYVWSKESGEYVPLEALKGESAYELAKKGGYAGTEEEFIAILNGFAFEGDGKHYSNFNNPHKVTAQQVGALPITGGTLTGKTVYFDNGNACLSGGQGYMLMDVYENTKDSNNFRRTELRGGAKSLKDAFILKERINGVDGTYFIYGTHNKPSALDVGAVHLSQQFSGKDVLTMTEEGNYYITNAQNTPSGGGKAGYLRVVQHPTASDYRVVYWRGYNSNTEYVNILEAGTWLGWSANLHTGNINDSIVSKGSYAGAGSTSKTIPIRKSTQMVVVYATSSSGDAWTFGVLIRGMTRAHCNLAAGGEYSTNLNVSWADTSVTYGLDNADPKYSWNMTGATYHYVVIG